VSKQLIELMNLPPLVQSIIGATATIRSNKVPCVPEEMPIFEVFSVIWISAHSVEFIACGGYVMATTIYRSL
jgi:hypothetical protein